MGFNLDISLEILFYQTRLAELALKTISQHDIKCQENSEKIRVPYAIWTHDPTRSRRVVGSNLIWDSDFSEFSLHLGPVHTTPEESENGDCTLKTHQMCFVHTRKRIKCFPLTLRRRNLKTQQSQAAEKLECTREHAHSKVLVEPTWRSQHGCHHFGRHFGFVFEEDSGRQITWLSWRHRCRKTSFSNIFRPH